MNNNWTPERVEEALVLAAIADHAAPVDPRRLMTERLEALRAELAPLGLCPILALAGAWWADALATSQCRRREGLDDQGDLPYDES
jgi:hypothetical protein